MTRLDKERELCEMMGSVAILIMDATKVLEKAEYIYAKLATFKQEVKSESV